MENNNKLQFCPKCGSPLIAGKNFCSQCGTNITLAQQQQPTQQANPYAQPQQPTQQANPYARPQQSVQQANPYAQPQQPTQQANPYAQQQQTAHSTIIALIILCRHTPFIHPINPHPHPRSHLLVLVGPNVKHQRRSTSPTECKIKGLFRLTLHHRNQMFNQRMCRSCSRMVNITFHNSQYSSVLVKFLHGLVHSAPCSCIIASLSKGPHVPTGYPYKGASVCSFQ